MCFFFLALNFSGEELEEMAKTIEYLERERLKQEDYLEQKSKTSFFYHCVV